MKKREFIAAICFICIFGMLVTVQVKRFVSSPEQRAGVQEYAAQEEYELKKADQTGSVLKEEAEPQTEARQADAARIQEKEEAEAGQKQGSQKAQSHISPEEYPEGRARAKGAAVSEDAASIPEAGKMKAAVPDTPALEGPSASREGAAAESRLEGSGPAAETAKGESGEGGVSNEEGAMPRTRAAASDTAPEAAAQESQESQKAGQAAASSAMISPAAETAAQAETAADEAEQATAQAYQRELDSAAASIKKLKSSETDTSTWSYLNLADYELKLWDDLLNRIYQDIIENMDETEAEGLRKEEKAWIKKRDADAKRVSSRYSGGTLEGLEHTASLAKSTKERAYELLEDYGSFLPQEEVSEEK